MLLAICFYAFAVMQCADRYSINRAQVALIERDPQGAKYSSKQQSVWNLKASFRCTPESRTTTWIPASASMTD
jgi:hypothetical protein